MFNLRIKKIIALAFTIKCLFIFSSPLTCMEYSVTSSLTLSNFGTTLHGTNSFSASRLLPTSTFGKLWLNVASSNAIKFGALALGVGSLYCYHHFGKDFSSYMTIPKFLQNYIASLVSKNTLRVYLHSKEGQFSLYGNTIAMQSIHGDKYLVQIPTIKPSDDEHTIKLGICHAKETDKWTQLPKLMISPWGEKDPDGIERGSAKANVILVNNKPLSMFFKKSSTLRLPKMSQLNKLILNQIKHHSRHHGEYSIINGQTVCFNWDDGSNVRLSNDIGSSDQKFSVKVDIKNYYGNNKIIIPILNNNSIIAISTASIEHLLTLETCSLVKANKDQLNALGHNKGNRLTKDGSAVASDGLYVLKNNGVILHIQDDVREFYYLENIFLLNETEIDRLTNYCSNNKA